MKTRGFTLIELLGVLVVIGIILTVSFTAIPNILKSAKDKEYKNFLDNIFLATESYVSKYSNIEEEGIYYISIEDLLEKGLIKDKEINPKTEKEIDKTDSVRVIAKINSHDALEYDYEFVSSYKNYIQDGLVIQYDVTYNESTGYNPLSNSWYDLSGNGNTGIINGNIWKNGGLYFDGVDDWVNMGEQNYPNVTLEVVVNHEALSSTTCYINNFESGGYGIRFTDKLNFMVFLEGATGYEYLYFTNKSFALNKVYSLSGSFDNNTMKHFINNDKVSVAVSGSIKSPDANTVMALGANPSRSKSAGEFFQGTMYSVRVYNRALSDNEVKHNYELDKERFGIGE